MSASEILLAGVIDHIVSFVNATGSITSEDLKFLFGTPTHSRLAAVLARRPIRFAAARDRLSVVNGPALKEEKP